jgi:hypothetical protein
LVTRIPWIRRGYKGLLDQQGLRVLRLYGASGGNRICRTAGGCWRGNRYICSGFCGTIDYNGLLAGGTGATAINPFPGLYKVVFNTPFLNPPDCVIGYPTPVTGCNWVTQTLNETELVLYCEEADTAIVGISTGETVTVYTSSYTPSMGARGGVTFICVE